VTGVQTCALPIYIGEMAKLTNLDIEYINCNKQEVAMDFAKEYNCIVLLKGANTIVTDGNKIYVNTTGNPGMASGGSGDALTGIIVSLIGQGYSAFDSAALGAYLHGMAGDRAFSQYGYGLIASDIIDCIGNYLKG
jgi:ADP-dependent NAD(P)H-hydrate dehydratase / NAD(P)H-hydrate epimerase